MDHLCYLCLVFVILSRVCSSPAWKGLTSWHLFVVFNCAFVIFPCDVQGQVWYLIVLIPDLRCLSYFELLRKAALVVRDITCIIHLLQYFAYYFPMYI